MLNDHIDLPQPVNDIHLSEGFAAYMGDGVYVILQRDERRRPQVAVLNVKDLEALWDSAQKHREG